MSVRKVNSAILLHVQKSAAVNLVTQRNISTTVPLQRVKRKQSRYHPGVPPFTYYGATHRLMRGASVKGDRYGPLFDKPDYTFLGKRGVNLKETQWKVLGNSVSDLTDTLSCQYGRPTPLTPEQMKQKVERRGIAENVVRYLQEIDTVKSYNEQKKRDIEDYKKQRIAQRLKTKS